MFTTKAEAKEHFSPEFHNDIKKCKRCNTWSISAEKDKDGDITCVDCKVRGNVFIIK